MRYFPISVDTKGKNILVLGGGNKATEKVKTLLKTEFKIYVISLEFNEELINLREEHPNKIFLKGRMLNEDFVFFGYDYCIIATNDLNLNSELEARALKSKIPHYRADLTNNSSFLFNEIVNNSTLSVSVSADGLNPTMAKIVTSDIEKTLMLYDEEKIELLNTIRRQLIIQNYPNVEEEIEKLSKSNLAIIKDYAAAIEKPKAEEVEVEEILEPVEGEEVKETEEQEEVVQEAEEVEAE